MIELSEIRVFLCTIPTKMNYSFDTLMGLAQQIFDQDPPRVTYSCSSITSVIG